MPARKKSRKSGRARQAQRVKRPAKKSTAKVAKSRSRVATPKTSKIKRAKVARVKTPATRDVKSLRAAFSKLKKLGLISSSKKVSSIKKGDKTATSAVKRFSDVVSGKAKVHKVGKDAAKDFKETGYVVVGDKIILPVERGVKIHTKDGKIFRAKKMKSGEVRTVSLPVPYRNLRQFLENAKTDHSLEALLPPGSRWAFRMYGHNSFATYSHLDLMIEDLDRYESVGQAINEKDAKHMREIYKNLEIVQVNKVKNWKPSVDKEKRKTRKKRTTPYGRAYRSRLRVRQPKRYETILFKEREAARKKYNALKRDKKRYREYLLQKKRHMQRLRHNV